MFLFRTAAAAALLSCVQAVQAYSTDPCKFTHDSEVTVADASGLASALAGAKPGRLIRLRPGVYAGRFKATVSGTKDHPITVCGPRDAVLDGGATSSGYVFHLSGVKYWTLSGMTIRRGKNGIMLDRSSSNRVIRVLVHAIGNAGIHVRRFSNYNLITLSEIRDTGRLNAGYGEGVYLGSAKDNWAKITGSSTTPDRSNGNKVRDNAFGPGVRAEAIDVKEGTSNGRIEGNTFDGTGMTGDNYADSWIDVKGNGYWIADNTGFDALRDGFQTHVVLAGWGNDNIFANNLANVDGPGVGFFVHPESSGNQVLCDNEVNLAGRGYANVPCDP